MDETLSHSGVDERSGENLQHDEWTECEKLPPSF